MNFKPADFLISVFEFFSVLLPGVMVCFFINIQYSKFMFGADKFLGTMDSKGVERWIIFLFASYLIGHLLYALGSKLDTLYDRKFRSNKAARNFDLTFLAAHHLKTMEEGPIKKNTIEDSYSLEKFEKRKYRHNGSDTVEDFKFALLMDEKMEVINTYKWIQAAMTLYYPAASAEITYMESSQKFFRTLVVSIALLIVSFLINFLINIIWIASFESEILIASAFGIILLILCWNRFTQQRFKTTEMTYQFLITLRTFRKPQSDDKTA